MDFGNHRRLAGPAHLEKTLDAIISDFGSRAKAKLSNAAVSGAPEDQLRAPLEGLIYDLGEFLGLPRKQIAAVGETSLADLKTRPDYAVTLNAALVGFIEVKAPGKGADPRRFADRHDREQWDKLQTLPNLIYTDGNAFSLWRNGDLEGKILTLDGDIETAGAKLTAPAGLPGLFADFFQWQPQPPKSAPALAELTARLCRLLREEVTEQLARGSGPLTNLATDWRKLLFPSASNEAFADGYAQAVTFGLLMARARRISLSGGLDRVAGELRQTNTLIGTALRLLTDDAENQKTLKTSLATLTRVLDAVHWDAISKGDPETWLYFYETFLTTYDSGLRRKTGSYYTPPEVVLSMVRLVDEALKSGAYFGLTEGLASPDVTVADPATGTGTYLLGVLRRIAETTAADQGPGAVPGVIEAAIPRLIGFELQLGPFAVAQLRLLAELQELVGDAFASRSAAPLRLFVTDTLGNPFVEDEYIPQILMPLGESRRQANRIKRQERITVVIGNPPYKDKAKGLGGWIEQGSANRPGQPVPLTDWMPPPEWNVGAHAKHLRNLYVYFWRWAAWKVFGDGDPADVQGRERDQTGIVCFITAAGFLNGPGFQKMRADLRAEADEIWVIDCSPEGHQPPIRSRIFQGVQQPVCIVMALRKRRAASTQPARVRYRTLDGKTREDKFAAFAGISLEDDGWAACPDEPRAPFLPKASGAWGDFVPLEDLFTYNGSGVMPGRVWVIAPDRQSLEARWDALVRERDAAKKEALFHPHLRNGKPGDKHLNKELKSGLYGHEFRANTVASDTGNCIAPARYGFQSFNRQWIIPDGRVINQPNPTLWETFSNEQVFLTVVHRTSPKKGPGVTFSALVCDLNHYNGRGGRVFPLWADNQAANSNVKGAFLDCLSEQLGTPVGGQQVMAYLAAVIAHPGYTRRFQDDLVQPGLRLPLTRDAALFAEAVTLGEAVIWLHTFGERYADPSNGRPAGPPRLPKGDGPLIPRDGAIPSDPVRMPDRIDYDAAKRRLLVGEGFIDNVPPEVWQYEVSGKQVLAHWFSYRRKDRTRPVIGERRSPSPLEKIQPDRWLAEYTTELLNVLHVLGRLVALEPRQADLLTRISAAPLVNADTLRDAGAFDVTRKARGGRADVRQDALL